MKILITGASGQLGYHLQQVFANHELYLGTSENFDITDREVVFSETEKFKPELIIHAAAYTNVDGAETNRELARSINVDGTKNVAQAAKAADAKLVAISTDYVFSGDKGSSYQETDQPDPVSYYGQTKYKAEQAAAKATDKYFIVRTSWLYGGPKPTQATEFSTLPHKNFVYTMLRVGKDRDEVEVVSDQIGTPTYANDLANTIKDLLATDSYGVYHASNTGITNWADFAREIFKLAKYNTTVVDISSAEWEARNPQSTKRPAYSVLGHNALTNAGLSDLRAWQDAIADFSAEM